MGDLNVFLGKLKGAVDMFPDEIKALGVSNKLCWAVARKIDDDDQLRDHVSCFHKYWKDAMIDFDANKQKALDPANLSRSNLWNLVDDFRYLLHLAELVKDREDSFVSLVMDTQTEIAVKTDA